MKLTQCHGGAHSWVHCESRMPRRQPSQRSWSAGHQAGRHSCTTSKQQSRLSHSRPTPSRGSLQGIGQRMPPPSHSNKRHCTAASAMADRGLSSAARGSATSTSRAAPSVSYVNFKDGTYTVHGTFESSASADQVYATLTDYDKCHRIFDNILENQTLRPQGELRLVQTCRWNFLIFSGKFQLELKVLEDAAARTVVFQLVRSSFMRGFKGQWQVRELEDGGSWVEHRMSVAPAMLPPSVVGGYTQRIFVNQVERILGNLDAALKQQGV